jgi:prolipoprotein diacylglyceryl transferase
VIGLLAAVGWPVLDRIRFGDSLAISPHGIGIAAGFLAGTMLLARIGPRRGVRSEDVQTIAFWAIVGAIVGARFFYVLAHLSEFDSVAEMFAIWRGGISLLGGIAGAILANVPVMRRMGYRFFQVTDPAMIALSLGIAIGRIGDLVIGDHLGKPTSWLLAFTYEGGTLAPPFRCAEEVCRGTLQGGQELEITREAARLFAPDGTLLRSGIGVHQTALYDIIGASLLLALLWWMARRARREGVLALTFGIWYGTMRLLTDSVRVDKRFFGLTGSQWTAATVVTISVALLAWWALEARRRGERPAVAREGPPITGPAAAGERANAEP